MNWYLPLHSLCKCVPYCKYSKIEKNLTPVIWVRSGEVNKFQYVITVSISLPIQFVLGSKHSSPLTLSMAWVRASQSVVRFAVAICDLGRTGPLLYKNVWLSHIFSVMDWQTYWEFWHYYLLTSFSVCWNVREIAAWRCIIALTATYMYGNNSYMNNFCVRHTLTI